MNALLIENLRFSYTSNSPEVLNIDRFELVEGERVFLKGASGSGKSTLLGLVSGVLTTRTGQITVLGERFGDLNPAQRDAFRANHMGVIFQMFNLLPYLPVGANITLPCRFAPQRAKRASDTGQLKHEAKRLLSRLGLDPDEVWMQPTSKLSVGQQQRVAVARALIGRPRLILADEPTSALDHDSREAFIALLNEECKAHNIALLFVSHDRSLAGFFDRALDLDEINRLSNGVSV